MIDRAFRAGSDMLQAMTTGHDGSLSTAHANTPRDMLRRLETMVLMTGYKMPLRAIRARPQYHSPPRAGKYRGRSKPRRCLPNTHRED